MFYSEQQVTWRSRLRPLTCSLCCYVICICYTSRSPVPQIQSTYTTSSSGSPSPAVHREQAVMWSWAADMGVCSDVNAVTLSLSFLFISGTLLRTALTFWSTQELMLYENQQAVHNLLYSWWSALVFISLLLMKFLSSLKQISAVTRPLLFLPFTSFPRSIFSVRSNALSPSVALPSLQSHWPILWRTVKGRRSVYCLASFLGQWDSAYVFLWRRSCLGLCRGILEIKHNES